MELALTQTTECSRYWPQMTSQAWKLKWMMSGSPFRQEMACSSSTWGTCCTCETLNRAACMAYYQICFRLPAEKIVLQALHSWDMLLVFVAAPWTCH